VHSVSRDEIRTELAGLDLRVNRAAEAKLALLNALTAHPGLSRVSEVLGMDAAIDGDQDAALERWQQALASGSTNPAIYYEVAGVEARQWFSTFDFDFRMPPERTQQLRDLLHRSIESAPKQAQAYEILAWVEATAEQPSAPNLTLVQEHVRDVLDRDGTLLALGVIAARVKNDAMVLKIVDAIEKNNPAPGKVAAGCRFLRRYVEKAAEPEASDP
jgi:hypothetical protein